TSNSCRGRAFLMSPPRGRSCVSDRPNGGVLVDAWHQFRSGGDDAALRAVPGDRVLGLQLDDGPVEAEPDLLAASLHDRLLPGAGELDLRGLLGTLREA